MPDSARVRVHEVAAEVAAGVLEVPGTRPGTVRELLDARVRMKARDKRLRKSTRDRAQWMSRPLSARLGDLCLSFHGLRHTFATLWLQNGGDLFRLSKILGHYSPEFTARQYAHVSAGDLVRTADQVRARISAAARGVTRPVTCDTRERVEVA